MSNADQATPRVERLRYAVRAKGTVYFAEARVDIGAGMGIAVDGAVDPAHGGTDEFRVTLEHPEAMKHGVATVEMISDYPTIDEARATVEPYLRAWEIRALLDHVAKHGDTQRPLYFEYKGADVSNPRRGDNVILQLSPAGAFIYRTEPPSPSLFAPSVAVDTMWLRWQEYDEGREPLPSMAYFCLTAVEDLAGGQ
ncbi:MAG: hypothetical protein QOF73_2722, partial [Thermomicrobiales bacterium]|nr:hypothetical protein [Thermomicrobiales bacterium]